MLYRIIQFIFPGMKPSKHMLGRWGYHWEVNKSVQKYYD